MEVKQAIRNKNVLNLKVKESQKKDTRATHLPRHMKAPKASNVVNVNPDR